MSQNNELVANAFADATGRFLQVATQIEAAVNKLILLHFKDLEDARKKVFHHYLVSSPQFGRRCDLLLDLLSTDANPDNFDAFKKTWEDKIKGVMQFRNKVVHCAIIPVPQEIEDLVRPEGEYQVLSKKVDKATGEREFATETVKLADFIGNIVSGMEALGELIVIEKRLTASLTS